MRRSLDDEDFCMLLDNHAERVKERAIERAVMARPIATYQQASAAVANQALQDADEGLAQPIIKARARALADEFALFPDERLEIVTDALMAVASRAA